MYTSIRKEKQRSQKYSLFPFFVNLKNSYNWFIIEKLLKLLKFIKILTQFKLKSC